MLAWEPIRYARNGDVSIAYRVGGAGPVDLLFISGFVSHLEIGVELALAQRFFERLGSFARIIAFDKRGMGLSDRARLHAGERRRRRAGRAGRRGRRARGGLRRLRGRLGRDDARRRPSAARQLAGPLRGLRAPGPRPRLPEGTPPEVLEGFVTRMAAEWGQAAMLELWAPSLAGDPEAVDWWARWLRSGTSPGAMRTIGLMYQELDVRPLLSSVTAPTLVLYRADDQLIRAPLARVVARGDPQRAGGRAGGRGPPLRRRRPGRDARRGRGVRHRAARRARPRAAARDGPLHRHRALDRARRRARRPPLARAAHAARPRRRARARAPPRAHGEVVRRRGVRDLRRAGARRPLRAGHPRAPRRRSGSSCAPASTPASARWSAATWPGWRSTSPRACRRPRAPARSSPRAPSRTSSSAPASSSRTAARHVLKGVPGEWPLYAVTGDAERAQPPAAASARGGGGSG